ncbi:MAG: stage IV sporulation protein A [Clostridiaceae bacterium]|jgi:stage IV sporulation protein A|nr:stage IV sporulation protein A [Clostridiaceae bacterium]
MDKFDIYNDIATRTGGDIYVGVVGPVRTGKSTFIKRFMEDMVVENIADFNARIRAIDELPQSADGKTIMTTQPKFVPNEAARVDFRDNLSVNVRLIDCVGYLVDGAIGVSEGGKERLVRTPWSEREIPFSEAAAIGTERVIREHSTVGILVTTDGTVTGLERGAYVEAEERVARELKAYGKPFAIVLNSREPYGDAAQKLRANLAEKYGVTVIAKDVINMVEADMTEILESVLMEFPVKLIDAVGPAWLQALKVDSDIIKDLSATLRNLSDSVVKMSDAENAVSAFEESEYFVSPKISVIDAATGRIEISLETVPNLFYKVISEECGEPLEDDFKLLSYMKQLKGAKEGYDKIKAALESVNETGYGVVMPSMSEMTLEEPVIVKQGGQFGVKLKASAPSLHVMRVEVETEVSPLVATEQQGEELVKSLLEQFEDDGKSIWDTNIFGKSLSALVNDGMNKKLNAMPEEARLKMRRTLQRIINEGRGGVICILL